MAYNDEALKAKLSTLNETQESIVSVSQWITFHRRYADRIAQAWLARLKDAPPPKRLNYIYLVNDIVQNAKARKRPEFPNAFSPLIAEAVQQTYRSSPGDIQNKIRRVVDVWKSRTVFEDSILQAIQARVDDVDKSKASSGKKTLMGKSLFSSSSDVNMPKELESLGPLQTAVTKSEFTTKPLVETALSEHNKLNDPNTTRPSAPVYAANLSSLIKKLAAAEVGLNESITARKALIADLKRLTDANETALSNDESLLVDVSSKRAAEESNKRDVEDSIMRGLAESVPEDEEGLPINDNRPDVEELTPEPEDTHTTPAAEAELPTRNPNLQGILAGFGGETDDYDMVLSPPLNYATPAITTAATTSNGHTTSGPPSNKKRKLSHDLYNLSESAVPDLGAMGVTGYDGVSERSSAAAYMTGQPFASSDAKVPNLTTTLEQDVDALIRGSIGE